ncbi:hypothetical protein [Thiohalobacter sp.]|uniref:hypothetical protein n=1 Tax=Thiohalobacter sp. TaxID=2025948 RepID=UPI0026083E78|nr:hypothetical protein [Thiohalobacter sp.]
MILQGPSGLAAIATAWALYGALHSLLASRAIKAGVRRHLPGLWARYRLLYNLFATLALIPPLWLTFTWEGPWLWRWTGAWGWLANGLAALALIGFWIASKAYDMPTFLGLRPEPEQPRLGLSPLHRYVRHPWYSLGLVILWTRDMHAGLLVTALVLTLYLLLGSRLEERRLEAELGRAYADYRRRVPGLLPWPGRVLPRADYDRLRGSRRG